MARDLSDPANKNYLPSRVPWDAERDAAVHKKAKELLESDPELKAMAEKSPYPAFRAALAKAAEMIPPGKGGGTGTSSTGLSRATSRDPASRAERGELIHQRALRLLRDNGRLKRLEAEDPSGAFKEALRLAATTVDPGVTTAPASSPPPPATLSEPVLERARQVHKGAMVLLSTHDHWRELAAKNYPDAFERAHRTADGDYGVQFLCVPMKTDANVPKPGSHEEAVYQNALTTLKTSLKSRDSSDSVGAFDEAIRDAEATTLRAGVERSPRSDYHGESPRRPMMMRGRSD